MCTRREHALRAIVNFTVAHSDRLLISSEFISFEDALPPSGADGLCGKPGAYQSWSNDFPIPWIGHSSGIANIDNAIPNKPARLKAGFEHGSLETQDSSCFAE